MSRVSVTQPSDEQLDEMGIKDWPTWTCEPSKFDWDYDQQETCYLLAGKVTVTAGDEQVSFGPGDMVVFPEGLDCVWEVAEPVRKHYKFG